VNIHDYIKKHSLVLCREYPDWPETVNSFSVMFTTATASVFVTSDSEEFASTDKFQIFSNAEQTHFVSLNLSARKFRIIYADMVIVCSQWESMERDYPTRAILGGFEGLRTI